MRYENSSGKYKNGVYYRKIVQLEEKGSTITPTRRKVYKYSGYPKDKTFYKQVQKTDKR